MLRRRSFGHHWVRGGARLTRFGARFVLSADESNSSILEGGIGNDWTTELGCDLLASGWGLEVGFVQTRGGAVSEAAAITELVIVEAIRTSDSGGEAI